MKAIEATNVTVMTISSPLPPEAEPFGSILRWQRQDYTDKLIQPSLLRAAVVIHGSGHPDTFWTQLAVPVGRTRGGGHVVVPVKTQAKRIAQALGKRRGFPHPRVIESSLYSPLTEVYYEVEWGNDAPADADNIQRGIYYGYSDDAILNFIIPQRRWYRMRRALLERIRTTRTQATRKAHEADRVSK